MKKEVFRIGLPLVFLVALIAVPVLSTTVGNLHHLDGYESYAVMFLDRGKTFPKEPVTLTLVISNPTIYNLVNSSLYFEFPLKTVFVRNASNFDTELGVELTGEDTYNVSVKIPIIPKNSTYMLNITFSLPEKGYYVIKATDIDAYKKKGELVEKVVILMNKEVYLTVEDKKESPIPPEGTTDATWIIAIITVLVPLVVMSFGHKFAWRGA